jgi:hypothetical protein
MFESFTPNFVIELLALIGSSIGVYAAIRADLREAMTTARDAKGIALNAQADVNSHINDHARGNL